MRIPFPERISYVHACAFGIVLCTAQLFEGTLPLFSFLCFCFILVATAAFNIAGGMPQPLGAFIGFNALFTVLLPTTVKALAAEPSHSNLHVPIQTIEVYVCGMVSMCVAAMVTRHFRPSKALISDMMPPDGLRIAYHGSVAITVLLSFLTAFVPNGNGSIGALLGQLNRFPALVILLGVIYTIRRTNGRRSVSWPLLGMMLFTASSGLYTFSKEAFLAPFFCWIVPVALMRFQLRLANIVCLLIGGFFTATYLMPYAQVGRDMVTLERSPQETAGYLLTHMDEVRGIYNENASEERVYRYYSFPVSLLDRLETVSVDDALIDVTNRQGYFGYEPVIEAFENFIPHFLWPNKPRAYFGNVYAHQIGILSADDNGTGVSFSPSADAFHIGGMLCVLLVEPLIFILAGLVLDRVIGDFRRNPVGLLTLLVIERAAAELFLTGPLSVIAQPLFATVACAYVCAYVLPVFGSFLGKANSEPSHPPLEALPTT